MGLTGRASREHSVLPVPLKVTFPRGLLFATITFVAAVALFTWRIGTPSAWRDEAVSWDVSSRPLSAILRLVQHVDAVHFFYYCTAHALHLLGSDFTGLRLFSAIALAAAVALTVLIGQELGSLMHGAFAAALVLTTPLASVYAQQARPYALTTCLATLSTWLVLRAARMGAARSWLGYGAVLTLAGLTNVISLLILPAHYLFVRATAPRATRTRTWFRTTAVSLLALSGFLAVALSQRGQVDWLSRPSLEQLVHQLPFQWTHPDLALGVMCGLIALGLSVRQTRSLILPTLAWGWAPAILLWLVSQVHPVFDARYLVFTMPGAALAVAAPVRLLADLRNTRPRWLGRVLPPGAVMVVVVAATLLLLSWPAQLTLRLPAGFEDMRGASRLLAQKAPPGSAVLFMPSNFRLITMMYPDPHGPLRDLTLQSSGRDSATLVGIDKARREISTALRKQSRLWVVTRATGPTTGPAPTRGSVEAAEEATLAACFTTIDTWSVRFFRVTEYARDVSHPHCSPVTPDGGAHGQRAAHG